MVCIGWSVLSRRRSQNVLKTYSCPDQNEMTSGISTQLAVG